MAYIVPNTDIYLIQGCPLDPTYEHTIWFDKNHPETQASYFLGLDKITISAASYQRVNKGSLKVQVPVLQQARLYKSNYMMFKNTSFENRWFYAFITGIDYINNITFEVRYQLDVMQTWMFDYELDSCFVERETAERDDKPHCLVPENLDTGEFLLRKETTPLDFTDYSIVACCTFSNEDITQMELQDIIPPSQRGGYYANLYTGLTYYHTQSASEMNAFIQKVTDRGRADGIVSMFMFPTEFCTDLTLGRNPSGTPSKTISVPNRGLGHTTTIGGYSGKDSRGIRNNKLFTAPYNQLMVTDNNGSISTLQYEYFGALVRFQCLAVMNAKPEMTIQPMGYKWQIDYDMEDTIFNYTARMTNASFPMCSYITDAYRAWIASAKDQMIADFTTAALPVAIGDDFSYGEAQGVIGTTFKIMGAIGKHSKLPPQAATASSITNMATNHQGFSFYNSCITPPFVDILDDYFDRFGYACHRNKVPNTHVRAHWTYTKTLACTITGSIPADDENKICSIYDKGITFWMHGNEVGHYELDNRWVAGD